MDLVDPKKAGSISASASRKEVQTLKMWVENVTVGRPVKNDFGGKGNAAMTPRECRELGLVYQGPMNGDLCYQINHRTLDDGTGTGTGMVEVPGKIVRVQKKFGDMPIMVMSKACHLNDKKPTELVSMKEEVGYVMLRYVTFVRLCYVMLR